MSHDLTQISNADLLMDLRAHIKLATANVAESHRLEPMPWRPEISALGALLGAVATLEELERRRSVGRSEGV